MGDPSVNRPALNPLSHTSQSFTIFFLRFYLFIYLFIYFQREEKGVRKKGRKYFLFNKYLLSSHHLPGTAVGAGIIALSKSDEVSDLTEFIF